MKNHEDESVYVNLDYSDALESKKELYEVVASVINMQLISEKMKNYKNEEISGRNRLKKEVKEMISEINHIIEKMPKVKLEKFGENRPHPHPASQQPAAEKKLPEAEEKKRIEKRTLNEELLDIKRRIESLQAK